MVSMVAGNTKAFSIGDSWNIYAKSILGLTVLLPGNMLSLYYYPHTWP